MSEEVAESITNGIAANSLAVIGVAPAMSVGELYQTLGDAVSKAAINNVFVQQQANITGQAACTAAVTKLLELPI